MKIRYKYTEPFVVTPVTCHTCGKKHNFCFMWRITKIVGRLRIFRSSLWMCKECAPYKHQFAAYFLNKARLDALEADRDLYETRKKATTSLSKQARMINNKTTGKRHYGSKCPCGSGKKYKNCCKKKDKVK